MSDAKRFGGAHSPTNARTTPKGAAPGAPRPPRASWFSGRKARRFSWRVLGLYIAPSALLIAALQGVLSADLPHILWSAGGWAALMLAAKLTGDGIRAQEAYDERIIARPPAFPRKLVAAALSGIAVAAISLVGAELGLPISIFYGLLAAGAHVVAFGPDPMRAKGGAGVSPVDLDSVAQKLAAAESVVAETVATAERLRDRGLSERIDRLAYAARDILREIEADPRDMRRARRFLSVHLVGLRDSTVKFAAAREKGAAADIRSEYEALLGDLEKSFAKQRASLLADDQTDLEVEIEVLRDRLKQEGAL
ncbi:MAG: 5-bromo-4-chloroindolyl phosphate hydrolysis family protein [Paracoccaceae bacterium]